MSHFKPPVLLLSSAWVLLLTAFFYVLLLQYPALSPAFRLWATLGWALFSAVLSRGSYLYRAYLQQRAMRGKKHRDTSADAYQERTFEIDQPFDAAFNMALEVLDELDNAPVPVPDDPLVTLGMHLPRRQRLRLRTVDRAMGEIDAGLRARLMGIPDVVDFSQIAVRLQRIDTDTTRVKVVAQPNHIGESLDMGKNLHTVNQIARTLRERAYRASTAADRLRDDVQGRVNEPDTDASAQNITKR